MRDRWTDERLDDLNAKVDNGFRRMDERFTQIDARLDSEFGRIHARFDSLAQTLVLCAITFSAAVIAGFVALAVAAL
jgi:hypothetical protein